MAQPALIPMDLAGGTREAMVPRNDAWLMARYGVIVQHPGRDGADVLPFRIADIVLRGKLWDAKGVGVLGLPHDGNAWGLHPEPGKAQAFVRHEESGRVYWVAAWWFERPVLIQVWDILVEQRGTDVQAHIFWRPGFPRPKMDKRGLEDVPRKERDKLEKAMWDFLEARPKTGPKPTDAPKPPDKKFERSLEKALVELILFYKDASFKREDILTALDNMPVYTYYRKLRQSGWTSQQIQEWVAAAVAEWEGDGSDTWRPRRGLQRLPRNFCN